MSNICPKCGQTHFPISTYKKWLKQYSHGKASPKLQAQLDRWQKIVTDHEPNKSRR